MHTIETRYFRSETEAKAFVELLKKPRPDAEAYVRLGPTLTDDTFFTDPDGIKIPAWLVKYEEFC